MRLGVRTLGQIHKYRENAKKSLNIAIFSMTDKWAISIHFSDLLSRQEARIELKCSVSGFSRHTNMEWRSCSLPNHRRVLKNGRTAAVVRALPKLTEYRICSAPCVHRQCTVVFAWKCCLFCLCAHGQCRVHHIYHVEIHFRFRRLVSFLV